MFVFNDLLLYFVMSNFIVNKYVWLNISLKNYFIKKKI